jgi:hypothetical protein
VDVLTKAASARTDKIQASMIWSLVRKPVSKITFTGRLDARTTLFMSKNTALYSPLSRLPMLITISISSIPCPASSDASKDLLLDVEAPKGNPTTAATWIFA